MKLKLLIGLFGILIFHFATYAGDTRPGPQPGLKPLNQQGQMQISDQDRCPVCAMKVGKHRKFAGAIQLTDGKTFYFCGTGCLIRSWMHPEFFLKATRQQLKQSVVQDYFTGEQVDARSVYWVAGSDVVGPMGPALVPLKSERHLDAFKKRHGGRAVFRLSEMTDEKWRQLTGEQAVPGKSGHR